MEKANKEIAEKISGKKRSPNLDLVRTVAVLSVLSVHFFLNTEFYQQPMVGERMLIMTFMRTGFMVCVPLFVLLTGFLMCRKELTRQYYQGVLHTLATYIVISLFCNAFRYFYLHETVTVKSIIKSILQYNGSEYAWYIEMYLGLFLLIPFLNVLYKGLDTKRRKQLLILTLLATYILPTVLNVYKGKLIPEWWTGSWPLLYYFTGAYLSEYRLCISTRKNFLLFAGILLLNTGYCWFRCAGGVLEWSSYNDWAGWQNAASATALFVLLINLDLSGMPEALRKLLSLISRLSLGIYLSSWMADQWYYPRFCGRVSNMVLRLNYFPVSVIAVFLLSLLSAAAAQGVLACFGCLMGKIIGSKRNLK